MFDIIKSRLKMGNRTIPYPRKEPVLPDRFRGFPSIDTKLCPDGCAECSRACPTGAIARDAKGLRVDIGRCIFCVDCERACPKGAIRHTQEYRLARRKRDELYWRGEERVSAEALGKEMRRLFGRSLKLRQVSAGGCNACEADVNVLSTVVFDMGRFGLQFVASPRHADGLLVTGPVTQNMRLALKKSYDALPSPRIVIASGACAISGGIYSDHPETLSGADSVVPVDLFIPGCPPHPMTTLDGLLRLMGRLGR